MWPSTSQERHHSHQSTKNTGSPERDQTWSYRRTLSVLSACCENVTSVTPLFQETKKTVTALWSCTRAIVIFDEVHEVPAEKWKVRAVGPDGGPRLWMATAPGSRRQLWFTLRAADAVVHSAGRHGFSRWTSRHRRWVVSLTKASARGGPPRVGHGFDPSMDSIGFDWIGLEDCNP